MINSLRTHPLRWAAGAVAGLGVLAWLAFGYFGVHTLFIDDVVSEAAPTFDSSAAAAAETTQPEAAPVTTQPEAAPETTQAETTPSAPAPEPEPTTPTESPAAAPPTTVGDAPPVVTTPATTVPPTPEIVTEAAGTFTSAAHPTSGEAVVLGNGTGQRFLRFEDFATDNGPDLNVYLVNSSTGDVSDYIDLGDLKGNVGEQNYEIPTDVDLSTYDTVWIWCVRFSSGFGSAELALS